jgi:predicted O-linked N-acetylglucosamine transferase (SPINDLY family)
MSLEKLQKLFLSAAPLHRAGDLDGAEALYRQAIEEFPNNPDARHLLGVIAHQRGNNHEALGLILHAIDQNPNYSAYHGNLGVVWMALGRFHRAADAFRNSARLDPRNEGVHISLERALAAAGEYELAVAACQALIDLNPNHAEAHGDLGVCYENLGDLDRAIAAYRQALRLNPKMPGVHSNLIFAMERHEADDAKAIFAEQKEWNRIHAQPLRHLIKPLKLRPMRDRKLRIGWVSPDFRQHVVARCLLPVFRKFDRGQFENFCYYNYDRSDPTTAAIRSAVDQWRDIDALNDDQTADLIRDDGIDVLVDLALHSGKNRLPVFARKPAPVQVCYLGYCGSTGLETMDFRISDSHLDPPDAGTPFYSEKTVRLSGSYLCYSPDAGTPEISAPPAIRNGFVTFACLNSPCKISTQAVDLWGRILNAVAGSRLIIHASWPQRRRGISDRLKSAGINPGRLEFVAREPWPQYMATYSRVDIALDTFPCGAGIMAGDALYMGVPMVTLCGSRAVGRMCSSILLNIGHPELIARTPEQYVKIAAGLAADVSRLGELRAGLRGRLESSPVMNCTAIAKELQDILKKIYMSIEAVDQSV